MSPIFKRSFKLLLLIAGFMLGVMLSNLFIGSFLQNNDIGGGFRNAQDNVISTSTVSITPNTNNAYDLGSASYAWKDIYVAGVAYLATRLDFGANNTADIGRYDAAAKDIYVSSTAFLTNVQIKGYATTTNGYIAGTTSTFPNFIMKNGGNIWASTTQDVVFLTTSTVPGHGAGFRFDTADGSGTDSDGGNVTFVFGGETGEGSGGGIDLYTRSGGSEFEIGSIFQLSERSWGVEISPSNLYFDIAGFYSGGGDWIYGSRFSPARSLSTTSTIHSGTLGQTFGQVCFADSDGSGLTCLAGNNGVIYAYASSTL